MFRPVAAPLQRGLGTGEAGAKVGVLRFFFDEPAEVKHGSEPLPRRFRFRRLSAMPAPGVEGDGTGWRRRFSTLRRGGEIEAELLFHGEATGVFLYGKAGIIR